jgi:hypothetical protein
VGLRSLNLLRRIGNQPATTVRLLAVQRHHARTIRSPSTNRQALKTIALWVYQFCWQHQLSPPSTPRQKAARFAA